MQSYQVNVCCLGLLCITKYTENCVHLLSCLYLLSHQSTRLSYAFVTFVFNFYQFDIFHIIFYG